MNKRVFLFLVLAAFIHVLIILLVSVQISPPFSNTDENSNVTVTIESDNTDTKDIIQNKAKLETVTTKLSVLGSESDAEEPISTEPAAAEPGPTDQTVKTTEEPTYLIDTPPKFIERGPISFPHNVKNLTESISIVVYLSFDATGKILSIDTISKWEELKLEVIKMILKSKFSPAFVGETPVPCIAMCEVDIICTPAEL